MRAAVEMGHILRLPPQHSSFEKDDEETKEEDDKNDGDDKAVGAHIEIDEDVEFDQDDDNEDDNTDYSEKLAGLLVIHDKSDELHGYDDCALSIDEFDSDGVIVGFTIKTDKWDYQEPNDGDYLLDGGASIELRFDKLSMNTSHELNQELKFLIMPANLSIVLSNM